jgi:hypothetical protein
MSPENRVSHATVRIPKTVSVDGDYLVCQWDEIKSRYRRITDRTLLDFTRLADAGADEIRLYAERHGILGVVQIDVGHQREHDIPLTDGTLWRLDERLALAYGNKEPLGLWQSLAQRMRAILRINAALKGRVKTPRPSAGQPLDLALLGAAGIDHPRDAQSLLLNEVNWWLSIGRVRLELGIKEFSALQTGWRLDVAYDGLGGGLAYRLLLMVTGESRLFACDGCGTPYIRDYRAPRPGEENFCPDCQEQGIAQKRANQRSREKGKHDVKKTRKR